MPKLITSNQKLSEIQEKIGGKATNLFRLKELGINVPTWIVIPSDFLSQKNNTTFSDDFIKEILNYFDKKNEEVFFAVRSSGIDEDGAKFSFAGQFETFLYVKPDELSEKIEAVKKSALSERVQKYRKENKLEPEAEIAVIIQKMINPEVSGVAFGIDPTNGDTETKIISSVYGVGEGLVSGKLDADTYSIKNEKIISQITKKTTAFVCDTEKSGIKEIDIAPKKQNLSSLNNKQLKEIADLLDKLQKALGKPQDIEFAFAENKLYLLQTRPITATGSKQGEYTLWDNSNIVESYPGITTPLTFSFIIKMYEAVYRQFVSLLGLKENEINKHSEIFANTLGLIKGRVYYNLLNWYKMLAMVPGYSLNAEFMENMMGVKEKFELREDFRMNKGLARLRIIGMIFKMIKLHRNLPKEREKFLKYLNKTMLRYSNINFSELSAKEIKGFYIDFEQNLLKKWKAPLINDFFAMIWFGVLQKMSAKYKVSDNINIHNDLLCGSSDIISTEPIHRSIKIAGLISANPEAKELFLHKSENDIYKELQKGKFPEIKNEINDYISKFGERCVGELKLETISYSQNPELFIKIIKSYVTQNITVKNINNNIETDIRKKAEEDVRKNLKYKFLKRKFYNLALLKARDLVSNRENLRYERTRAFGIVRMMFSEIGNKLAQDGAIENPRDIFMLRQEEIFDLIESKGIFHVTGVLITHFNYKNKKTELPEDYEECKMFCKNLIQKRKQEFSEYKTGKIPEERFFTYGNNFSDEYIYSTDKIEEITGDLKGIGCSPGIVKGKVQIVIDPNQTESLNGNILVTSSTDPGWVTLFPTASAIIVERGSLLSHSAIVSREMGIPCIVSVTGLLRKLKTGDNIIMNGSTGKISII